MSNNPFISLRRGAQELGAITAADRIFMVRRFDREQCEAGLQVPYLQTTVRKALLARLRKVCAPEGAA